MTQTDRLLTPEEGRVVPTLVDYLQVLRRRRWIFLLAVLLVPTVAVVLSMQQPPSYEASAKVLVEQESLTEVLSGGQSQSTDPTRDLQTEAELARGPAVARRAIQTARIENLTPTEFLKSSEVSPSLSSDLLTLSVTNSDPEVAKRLATAYAGAYTEYRRDLDMQDLAEAHAAVLREIRRLEGQGLKGTPTYRSLVRQERALTTRQALGTRTARVVRAADRAPKVGPKILRNEMIGLALGIVLGLSLAFLWDALDTRVRSVETLREGLGLRLLGRLSSPPRKLRKADRLVMLAAPHGYEAEAFRVLRASVEYANADYQARTIMVTSAVGGEGKSTTVANLALAFARAGRRVVLIDCDLRRPSLHRFFDLSGRPGLVDVELGQVELEDALYPIQVSSFDPAGANRNRPASRKKGTLEVLPAGRALQAPDELGVEVTVARIADTLRNRADLVLIDAAPLLPVGDAISLSAYVDALVVVVRLNSLRAAAFDELGRTLGTSPAAKLGFILTGTETSDAYGQFYRYAAPERGEAIDLPVLYDASRASDE